MKRKEVLIAAVVGGCIGAVLTMSVGLFIPVGVVAQSNNHDVTFGTITCGMIKVVDERGITRSYINAYGGIVYCDSEGKTSVAIGRGDKGGGVFVFRKGLGTLAAEMGIDEHGGVVAVYNNQGKLFAPLKRASMSVNAFGNGAVSTWNKNGYRQ